MGRAGLEIDLAAVAPVAIAVRPAGDATAPVAVAYQRVVMDAVGETGAQPQRTEPEDGDGRYGSCNAVTPHEGSRPKIWTRSKRARRKGAIGR